MRRNGFAGIHFTPNFQSFLNKAYTKRCYKTKPALSCKKFLICIAGSLQQPVFDTACLNVFAFEQFMLFFKFHCK